MSDMDLEILAKLKTYEALLLKWQKSINLISPNTVQDVWKRHFEDSLQLANLVPSGTNLVYDLGSGAGFAGMVLAIARPDISVTLIESDSKKCAFLQAVSRETETTVKIENERVEKLANILKPPQVISARALADLSSLLQMCVPWLKKNPSITAIFPKGENWKKEMSDAYAKGWSFHVEQIPSKTDKNAMILVLSNIITPEKI
jgi:16S rRNA (guanine527-N7)-methyltransferase